jgi:formate dehydrogenase major subunit
VPGLGTSFGRGAATTFQQDLANADCILIMGSNMAEAHPVGFRWPMKARERGATLVHVDPRFTRTSAACDLYVPIRAGSDIAFLGGLVNYVLTNERWFREYVLAFTNAATIVTPEYRDAEDLDGLFVGYDAEARRYDPERARWNYARDDAGQPATHQPPHVAAESFAERSGDVGHAPTQDPTLEHPMCVMNVLRRHFARYTPEAVAAACGCSEAEFLRVAELLCANSGRERTSAIVYAVGWTQHTTGVQIIRAAGILQLLLGNMGRPGGGIMAMRGHAGIQGSTDVPTLYDLLPGYLLQPVAHRGPDTLETYLESQRVRTGWWANMPKFVVSLLKAWYGEAATAENGFGYDFLPRVDDDYSQLATALRMRDGGVRGFFLFGQNPAAGAPNAGLNREGLKQLDWLVVRDWFEIESACFWYKGPEGPDPKSVKTEVFFFPAAAASEKDGTLTNTQRLLQWHDKAIDPPGDCRSDTWFVYHLGRRLRDLYAGSTEPRDRGLLALTWDYERERHEMLPDGSPSRITDEPDTARILREMNGYRVADGAHVAGFGDLADDGSTACGCWIYSGVYPAPGRNRARSRRRDPERYTNLDWGFAWPANRRILYNRASADPEGRPWSERKRYVWWDEAAGTWTGVDIPDFEPNKPPDYRPADGAAGMDAIAGDAPFIMKPDGRGWLFAPTGTKDGPLPTHYEPVESPVANPFYGQQTNPVAKFPEGRMNELAEPLDERFPVVATTHRLTEHYLSGPMSRFDSWLNELQPEMFVELSPELAAERGIEHGAWLVVTTRRGEVEARAMVTRRVRPLEVAGRTVHQIGIPFHWGFAGETVGSIANDLTSIVLEPNVSIHEAKAFACDVRPGRLEGVRRDEPVETAARPTEEPAPDTPKSAQPEGQFS